MANRIYFILGDETIFEWKWEIPVSEVPLLRWLFHSRDIKEREYLAEEGVVVTYPTIETTVGTIIKRFGRLNFTHENLSAIISSITDIPVEDLDFAFLDEEDFENNYPEPNGGEDITDEVYEELYRDWEAITTRKEHLENILFSHNLGTLPELREIRAILDKYEGDTKVWINFYETREIDPRKFVSLEDADEVRFNRKYLEMAYVYFSLEDYDLVYIVLFIALETKIKQFMSQKIIKRIGSDDGRPLNKVLKNVSVPSIVELILAIYGEGDYDSEIFESLVNSYNVRSNIIHNNARRFKRNDVMKAISTVDSIIQYIEELN